MAERKFHCQGCGARVALEPGAEALTCPYCSASTPIPRSEEEVEERDLEEALARGLGEAPTWTTAQVRCDGCGASTQVSAGVRADRCPFCDAPLTVAPSPTQTLVPQALLPFGVDAKSAKKAFGDWLSSRWFAPGDLVRRARREGMDGVYLPYFTFDAATETFYRGQRGDAYYVERTITERDAEGNTVQRTIRERKIRWRSASGTVFLTFDDVLILASRGLPEKLVRKLEPWDLPDLAPFDERFLAGFRAEMAQMGLTEGFEGMKARCGPNIDREIRRDIGGDEQRVSSQRTAWSELSYKHVLLPVWISAFRYRDKVYRVVVNARTGEVQGERPWSAWKIAGVVLLGLAIAAGIWWLTQR